MDTAPPTATAPRATGNATARRRDHRDRIATALERIHGAVVGKRGFGHSTSTTTATLGDGVRCVAVERSWQIESDLATALGGERAAPNPSELLRAALANCLAMGYQLRAAVRGIELTSVRVTVETDSELRGMLLPDADAPPGFTAMRCHVEIESPADDHEIETLVDDADRLSPVLDTLTRPHTVDRTVSIVHGGR